MSLKINKILQRSASCSSIQTLRTASHLNQPCCDTVTISNNGNGQSPERIKPLQRAMSCPSIQTLRTASHLNQPCCDTVTISNNGKGQSSESSEKVNSDSGTSSLETKGRPLGQTNTSKIRELVDQINSYSQNPELIKPDMISGLAKGIEALIKNDKTKKTDFSSELKTLSKGLLEVINNNHKENNFKVIVSSLYKDLYSLNKEINKSTTVEDFYVKPEEGCSNSWLEQMQKDTTAYGKIINKNVKYERRSSEIFNFMQGFVVLEIIHDSQKDDLTEEQKTNAEKRANQAIKDLDIYKIKLKDKKTFKEEENITIDDIVNEYGVKSQKEVGVKNSDIGIVGDGDETFITFFTHQYNTIDETKFETLNINGEKVNAQKNSIVKIAYNSENIKSLNTLINLLKSHCHENSYAVLTHLVHRAIERFGKSGNGYNLGQTIDSINKLLNLKDRILTNKNKSQIKHEELILLKEVKILKKEINNTFPNSNKIIEQLNKLNELQQLQNTDFTAKISSFINQLSAPKIYDSFAQYAQESKLVGTLKNILRKSQSSEDKTKIDALDNEVLLKEIIKDLLQINNIHVEDDDVLSDKTIKNITKIINQNVNIERIINTLVPNFELQKKDKPKKISKTIETALNDYKQPKEVKFSNNLKCQINQFLDSFIEYLDEKIPKDKRFTLTYSTQGDKYNYNAYELTTELGTLVLDDKGKMTTIIDKQLDK